MLSSNPHELTANEETFAFYFEIGVSITSWAHIELAMFWVMGTTFDKGALEKAAMMYFSIDAFYNKLKRADRLLQTKYRDNKTWLALHQKLERLAGLRNKLAHYHPQQYPAGRVGRRIALIPPVGPSSKHKQRVPKPPPGSLCVKDILDAGQQFSLIAYGLEAFYDVLKDPKKGPFPAYFLQAKDAPTMAQLTHRIRSILPKQPGSSPA